jgi:hypothetical protein
MLGAHASFTPKGMGAENDRGRGTLRSPPPMNCVHHSWQPALGACLRCGDYVCLRCVSQPVAAEPLCLSCTEREPPAEALPFDREGPWLDIVRATSVRVFKEPRRTFSRMADLPFDPAWRFAWAWSLLAQLPFFLFRRPWTASTLFAPVIAAASVTFVITFDATMHHVCVLALGGRARWKLSARAVAYAAPWWALGTSLAVLIGALLAVPATMRVLGASITADLVILCLLYLVGRHRQQLSPGRAWVAAAVGAIGPLAFKVALLVISFQVSFG